MNTYLTRSEVAFLTGRRQPAKQCEFLDAEGWCYSKDAHGRPNIFRKYHDARMSEKAPVVESTGPRYGVFLEKTK